MEDVHQDDEGAVAAWGATWGGGSYVLRALDWKICSKGVGATFPCQDHGQIPADAEEVEYPYTKVVGGCGLWVVVV